MSKITYLVGDATEPQGDGIKIIAHICNDIGAWGSGFVLALSKKWSKPEKYYREWYQKRHKRSLFLPHELFSLGNIQSVLVEPDVWVVNMIAQENIHPPTRLAGMRPPIRYKALVDCLLRLVKLVETLRSDTGDYVTVHMPRIGAGLAGGDWNAIEAIIYATLVKQGIDIYIYDLPPTHSTGPIRR